MSGLAGDNDGSGRKPCSKCGGPKPPGRGLRYCAECERKPDYNEPTQCHGCGSTDKRPKRQYCDECKALREWRLQTRRKAKRARTRKPCERCGRDKGPGRKKRICDRCRAARDAGPICRNCRQNPVRRPLANLCEPCAIGAAERRRVRHRESERRRRSRDTEAERERARERARKRAADPIKHAHDLETRRMRYRINAAREGREQRPQRHLVVASTQETLPSAPLVAVIDRAAARTDIPTVCDLLGLHERQASRWRRGEQPAIPFDVADQVMTTMDVLWWEVWNEDTVRKPVLVVRLYQRKTKLSHGRHVSFRVCTRTIPYGDQGPDRATLAEIDRMMSGEAVAA